MSRGNRFTSSGYDDCYASINLLTISKPREDTYDFLFRRWPRLEISRVVSEVATILIRADYEYNIYIAELCKLMSLFYHRELPSA